MKGQDRVMSKSKELNLLWKTLRLKVSRKQIFMLKEKSLWKNNMSMSREVT